MLIVESNQSTIPRGTVTVLASDVKKRGSQFMKKKATLVASKPAAKANRLSSILPNVSKMNANNLIFAFPRFNRSDSLLYLPHTLTKLMNSGDTDTISKLFQHHLDKNCVVMLGPERIGVSALLSMSRVISDIRPDLIICVRETKVVGNVIYASSYMKYTDVKQSYISDVINTADEQVKHKFTKKREYLLNKGEHSGPQRTDEEQTELAALAASDANVLVYATCNMMFIIDDKTKKIVKFCFDRRITSVHATEDI